MLKHAKGLGTVLVIAAVALSVFFLLKTPSEAAPTAETKAAEAPAEAKKADLLAAPEASKVDVEAAMKDRVLGKEDAPITIFEYASLTCSHCAHFATQILPQVKKQLLDTGKAKLVFRDFPLDKFAVKAAAAARCVAPEQYFNFLEVLFSKQDTWTKSEDPLASLQQLGSLAGLDAAAFKNCTENSDLEAAILKRMQEAQNKYNVQSTPTFVFENGKEQFAGAQPVEKFEAVIEKLTKEKK